MEQYSNLNEVMATKNHLKNGASLKIRMNKRKIFNLWLFLALSTAIVVFNSCHNLDDSTHSSTFDEGVVINGVKWATRNVDTPGTFAANPENAGMFYQWNRKKAWLATGENVTGWDSSIPVGDTWAKSNDPCPAGWRVPTLDELKKLRDTDKVSREWTTQNGVNGLKFTDKTTGKSPFLPAAGCRYNNDGTLKGVGLNGFYWLSTQYDTSNAYFISFYRGSTALYYSTTRSLGQSVRAVAK